MDRLPSSKIEPSLIKDYRARTYSNTVEPRRIKDFVDNELGDLNLRQQPVQAVCQLNEYVYNQIEYENTEGTISRPDHILEKKRHGDCEEQTALINTLAEATGVPQTGYISFGHEEKEVSHLAGFIAFPVDDHDPDALRSRWLEQVNDYFNRIHEGLGWFRLEDYYCLLMDAIFSEQPGCPELNEVDRAVEEQGLQLSRGASWCAGFVEGKRLYMDTPPKIS
jgi:hypothetical protein